MTLGAPICRRHVALTVRPNPASGAPDRDIVDPAPMALISGHDAAHDAPALSISRYREAGRSRGAPARRRAIVPRPPPRLRRGSGGWRPPPVSCQSGRSLHKQLLIEVCGLSARAPRTAFVPCGPDRTAQPITVVRYVGQVPKAGRGGRGKVCACWGNRVPVVAATKKLALDVREPAFFLSRVPRARGRVCAGRAAGRLPWPRRWRRLRARRTAGRSCPWNRRPNRRR